MFKIFLMAGLFLTTLSACTPEKEKERTPVPVGQAPDPVTPDPVGQAPDPVTPDPVTPDPVTPPPVSPPPVNPEPATEIPEMRSEGVIRTPPTVVAEAPRFAPITGQGPEGARYLFEPSLRERIEGHFMASARLRQPFGWDITGASLSVVNDRRLPENRQRYLQLRLLTTNSEVAYVYGGWAGRELSNQNDSNDDFYVPDVEVTSTCADSYCLGILITIKGASASPETQRYAARHLLAFNMLNHEGRLAVATEGATRLTWRPIPSLHPSSELRRAADLAQAPLLFETLTGIKVSCVDVTDCNRYVLDLVQDPRIIQLGGSAVETLYVQPRLAENSVTSIDQPVPVRLTVERGTPIETILELIRTAPRVSESQASARDEAIADYEASLKIIADLLPTMQVRISDTTPLATLVSGANKLEATAPEIAGQAATALSVAALNNIAITIAVGEEFEQGFDSRTPWLLVVTIDADASEREIRRFVVRALQRELESRRARRRLEQLRHYRSFASPIEVRLGDGVSVGLLMTELSTGSEGIEKVYAAVPQILSQSATALSSMRALGARVQISVSNQFASQTYASPFNSLVIEIDADASAEEISQFIVESLARNFGRR